jgi:hypothetical protein
MREKVRRNLGVGWGGMRRSWACEFGETALCKECRAVVCRREVLYVDEKWSYIDAKSFREA